MLFASCRREPAARANLRQNNEMHRGKVVVCKIGGADGHPVRHPNCGQEGTYAGSQGVVCKIAQPAALVSLLLPGAIALDRLRMCGTVLLPIGGMSVAPLAGAVPTDVAILGIGPQLVLSVLAATLLLAGTAGTNFLLWMRSGGHEKLMTEWATWLHSSRPTAIYLFSGQSSGWEKIKSGLCPRNNPLAG
jgi:hypothetical protein